MLLNTIIWSYRQYLYLSQAWCDTKSRSVCWILTNFRPNKPKQHCPLLDQIEINSTVYMFKRHVSSLKQYTLLATFNTPLISSICNPSRTPHIMHRYTVPRRLCPTGKVLPAAWWNHGKTTVCQGVYVQKARQQPQARYDLGNFQHSSNLFYMQPLSNTTYHAPIHCP